MFIGDAICVEQLVELLVIDSVRALDLPLEPRRVRANVDVADIPFLQVPMELGLELGAVVRLHDEHAERQARIVAWPSGVGDRPLVE
jgi:hypothetical protein